MNLADKLRERTQDALDKSVEAIKQKAERVADNKMNSFYWVSEISPIQYEILTKEGLIVERGDFKSEGRIFKAKISWKM